MKDTYQTDSREIFLKILDLEHGINEWKKNEPETYKTYSTEIENLVHEMIRIISKIMVEQNIL